MGTATMNHPRSKTQSTSVTRESDRRSAGRRGVTVVEASIVTPIFFLCIFGAIELCRVAMIRNLAEDASYVAARACMVDGATTDEATRQAASVLSMVGTRGAKVVINDGEGVNQASDSIRVLIDVPLSQNSWVLPWIFSGRSIQTYTQLRTERYDGYYRQ